jgi:MOSC domain-containing protein YiiM
MHIVSLNVGVPETLTYFGKDVQTGGRKRPVSAAYLHATNFAGDGQADLKNHGGPDKAVCVYPHDHYAYWERELGGRLEPGAFSENLTVAGARETEVCLGDVWQIGEALAQVSQPRQPCAKLAGKRGRKELPELIHATGFSGFYLRVLRQGWVRAGDPATLVERHPAEVTVQFVNELLYKQRTARADFERALAVEALSEAGRRSLLKRMTP